MLSKTMALAASILGMNLTLAYPEKYDVDPEYMTFADKAAKKGGAKIEIVHNVYEASKGVDVIYVKNWGSFLITKEEVVV